MSTALQLICAAIYFGVCADQMVQGHTALAFVYFGYAFAAVGMACVL